VVLFRSDDTRNIALMNNAMFDGLFDMAATCWNKVFAFNVDATNYVEPPPFKAEAERLVVMYGPNVLDTGDIWVTKTPRHRPAIPVRAVSGSTCATAQKITIEWSWGNCPAI
jgi:hypothetical protein